MPILTRLPNTLTVILTLTLALTLAHPDQATQYVSEALSFVRFKHAQAHKEFVEHVAQKAPLNRGVRLQVRVKS